MEEIVDKLHSAGLTVVFLPPALVNLCRSSTQTALAELKQFILSLSIVVILWTRPQDSYWSAGSWTRSDRRFITVSCDQMTVGVYSWGVIAEVFHSAWSDCTAHRWRLKGPMRPHRWTICSLISSQESLSHHRLLLSESSTETLTHAAAQFSEEPDTKKKKTCNHNSNSCSLCVHWAWLQCDYGYYTVLNIWANLWWMVWL